MTYDRNIDILENLEYEVNCASKVFQALSFDKVEILGIGSGGCIRNLYFQALEIGGLKKLSLLEVSKVDVAFSNHMPLIEARLVSMADEGDLDIIILYISCLDIVAGTDYDQMINRLNKNSNTRFILFKRGPINKRKQLPSDRYREIEIEIKDYKEAKYGR